MTSISISDLKTNPAKAIALSEDYPVEILNRNTPQAVLISKEFFDKLIEYLEDQEDIASVEKYRRNKSKTKFYTIDEVKKMFGL